MKVNNKRLISRIFIFLIINILLLLLLYNLPIETKHSLCIYKNITGKECFNCGMTRAFLSILHLNFHQAIEYNWRVVIVFPYAAILYLYTWWKYMFKNNSINPFKKFDKNIQK